MNYKWNDDWREELKTSYASCFLRLCECRNTHHDLVVMTKFMKEYNKGKTMRECFERVLEWVTDWNNQIELFPETAQEFENTLLECFENEAY